MLSRLAIAALCISVASAADKFTYRLPAANTLLANQLTALTQISRPHIGLLFVWGSGIAEGTPAHHDVVGVLTPQEALCMALSGTGLVPIPTNEYMFAVRHSEPGEWDSHCAPVDWLEDTPEWIHPPQADWR
jgi:hypothetical protein